MDTACPRAAARPGSRRVRPASRRRVAAPPVARLAARRYARVRRAAATAHGGSRPRPHTANRVDARSDPGCRRRAIAMAVAAAVGVALYRRCYSDKDTTPKLGMRNPPPRGQRALDGTNTTIQIRARYLIISLTRASRLSSDASTRRRLGRAGAYTPPQCRADRAGGEAVARRFRTSLSAASGGHGLYSGDVGLYDGDVGL